MPVINQRKCSCGAGSENIVRIRRNFIFRYLLAWLPVKRYQCQRCLKKISVFF